MAAGGQQAAGRVLPTRMGEIALRGHALLPVPGAGRGPGAGCSQRWVPASRSGGRGVPAHLQGAAVVTSRKKIFSACWYFGAPTSLGGWLDINSPYIYLADRPKKLNPSGLFVQRFLTAQQRMPRHAGLGEAGGTPAAPGSWPLPSLLGP